MTAPSATAQTIPPPHLPVRPEWLASRQESPLEPDRELVDPHHHLWDRPETSGRYLLPDLLADIAASGHQATRTVYVQGRSMYRTSGPVEACVRAKLGGVAMQEVWRPFVEASIDLFGPTRCLFESNFPVDKGMVGYCCLLWNAFKGLVAGYSEAERPALFAGTACDVYRLSRGAG